MTANPQIYICDDSPACAQEIAAIARQAAPDWAIRVFLGSDAFLAACRRCPPQIALLDVCIDGRNGFELAQELNTADPACRILFLSDYLQYATDAYDVEHVCYILKSQMAERLPLFLGKVMALLQDHASRMLPVTFGSSTLLLPQRDILLLEHTVRITYVVCRETSYRTYERVESLLGKAGPDFVQCHKSFVVNCAHIQRLNAASILLDNGRAVPISRRHRSEVQAQFMRFLGREGCAL